MTAETDDIVKILRKQQNIAGKDYFTIDEAAFYCCVSLSQFKEKAKEYLIFPFKFMGKVVYRKTDLQRVIEGEAQKQWQALDNARTPAVGNSAGRSRRRGAR